MSMVHRVAGSVTVSGEAHQVPWWLMLLVVGGGLVLVHLLRAVRTDDAQAGRWLQQRGLALDPRGVEATRQYLHRLRWSRVATTGLLIGGCTAAAAFTRNWISFVSLPFLLSVLVAETLAPRPRRGRLRTALLQRRPRSYFAPPWPLFAARASIIAGVGLSTIGAAHSTRISGGALLHGVVLAVGGCALEGCLRAISLRPLPDREPDLSLDTAMRVASARTATAAALVFGVFGLVLAFGYAQFGPGPRSTANYVVGQLFSVGLMAAVITAIILLQPLRSWHPREHA